MTGKTSNYKLGIDIGSTTAKAVIFGKNDTLLYSDYRRHHAEINDTMLSISKKAFQKLGQIPLSVVITGSAGMGLAERFEIPFVQEVIASAEAAQVYYSNVRTLIDIGGEDSKIIFFDKNLRPDIRMNGSCAGGTGAFIDQMAALINVPVVELNHLAEKSTNIYPIASRCGVFAKTDVQSLLSRDIPKTDIAASIYHAVAIQILNTLSRGFDVVPQVIFSGGPFAFMPMLRAAFRKAMGLTERDTILPERPELLPAIGAALSPVENILMTQLDHFIDMLKTDQGATLVSKERTHPLFADDAEFKQWEKGRFTTVEKADPAGLDQKDVFIGIDSGSTTSKLVMIDAEGKIVLDYYRVNNGNHMESVGKGLAFFRSELEKRNIRPNIRYTVATGYGEDLIKAAFNIDKGVVETIAHYTAAGHFNKDVSFILDIGGQDMKAMFIDNGMIGNIEINEACSSGCGSFIQTFAQTLKYSVQDFAASACEAKAPCDLGSRCTVFMNSKVKQFLREGAPISDISAGLAFSVIKNSLNKVLKITDMSVLGDHIMVQGGTFENPAIHRAFEILIGKKITCPNIMKLMGAYGAALIALATYKKERDVESRFVGLENIERVKNHQKKTLFCSGCENNCTITKIIFENKKVFYTGNKCEKIFTNRGDRFEKGFNFTEFKLKSIFDRETVPDKKPLLTVGIPRVLNMFENFPFWNTLFVESGIQVQLSDPSTVKVYEMGMGTVMSDNICFPAKLVHGHVINLVHKDVDRLFYPLVVFEQEEKSSKNNFNCPIVTGYPDVIRSAVNPEEKYDIPFDTPVISFSDEKLLKRNCRKYFKTLGIKKRVFEKSFQKALAAQTEFKEKLSQKTSELISKAAAENRNIINMVGRPYHCDSLINHKIPDIISNLGLDHVTGDLITEMDFNDNVHVLTQWTYSNRLYRAAKDCNNQSNVELVELNSFGCGPDTIAADEVKAILQTGGKHLTLLRIDEVSSPGSIRLRLRTLVESMKIRDQLKEFSGIRRKNLPVYSEKDVSRTTLVPYFADIYSGFITTAFQSLGINIELLPPSDRESMRMGLLYTNNEVCYPGILVVGDIIKALKSGRYDREQISIGITQTGGQCRASNYLSLIKKGMIAAGYEDIPILSISTSGQELNYQPGFTVDRKALIKTGLLAILYGDALSMMHQTTVVREKNPGESQALIDKYMERVQEGLLDDNIDFIMDLLGQAVKEFNGIDVNPGVYPRIGIVGEIFVKYCRYANHNVVDWLTENGIEVLVPPLSDFFIQELVNARINRASGIIRTDVFWLFSFILEGRLNKVLKRMTSVLKEYRYYRHFHSINEIADKARKTINLVNQYGEGWLITGEMMMFAEEKVENILCLQPFGCISNQVIAKGIEKRLKDLYPKLSILFFDLDPDTSEANFINRLHFLVRSAKETAWMNARSENIEGSSDAVSADCPN